MTAGMRRPWPVWVISIYYGLGSFASIFWNVRELIHHASFQGRVGAFGDEIRTSDHLIGLAGAALAVYAAMSLFKLKRIAWILFIAIFLLGPLDELYEWLTKPAFGAYFREVGYLALTSGVVVNGAALIYVSWLKQRGMLDR